MQEQQQRNALLERIRSYVDGVGIVNLSLETLAGALGMTPSELHEFFDTKEDLIVALIARDRVRQRDAYARIDADKTGEPAGPVARTVARLYRRSRRLVFAL